MSVDHPNLSKRRFSYDTLQSDQAFRLLKLLPGDGEALDAEIHHADLASPNRQPYDALSYTWGDPTNPRDLNYHDKVLPITMNLDMALRSLRLSEKPRWLWVDAVCIDQSNLEEKACQIGLMRSIYFNSEQTICFIGEEEHQSGHIIEMAEQVASRVKERAALSQDILVNNSNENETCAFILELEPRFLEDEHFKSESEILMGHGLQSCLMQLIIRPYFRRIWTAQEFIIPPKVILRCGDWSLSWYGLWYLVSLAYVYNLTYEGRVQQSDLCINQIRQRCRRRAAWWIKSPQNLQDMLNWMRTSEATQPVDKVYAVLPLASGTDNTESLDLRIDYSEPVCTVYSRFAKFIIEHGNAPRLLYDASRNFDTIDSTQSLPSWVPDWHTSRSFYSIGHVSWRDGGFYNGGGSWNGCMIRPFVSDDGNVLSISGTIIDEIKEVGSSSEEFTELSPHDWSYEYQLQLEADKLREFAVLTKNLTGYQTGESIETVIEKTVVGNELGVDYSNILREALAYEIRRVREEPLHMDLIKNDTPEATVWGDILWFLGWRRFALTKKGYIGLVHQEAKAHDHICLIPDAGVPFVIRPLKSSSKVCDYVLVGEAYIHGIMQGEACPKSAKDWKTLRIH